MSVLTGTPEPLAPELQEAYVRLVERRAGIRLSEQQLRTLDAAIAELLIMAGLPSAEALLGLLSSDAAPELAEELAARLTVPETHFFRVGPQIQALRDMVLPHLIQARSQDRRLAVWSAGCSTGEEPYTIAMLLRQDQPAVAGWRLRILGTDLNTAALRTARDGMYSQWSFRDTPPMIRGRYFEREGERWRIRDAIRRDVEFVRHNLVEPLPVVHDEPGTFDLILCRNVTIYFAYESAVRLYQRLAERLAPDGWLLLGPCDPPPPVGGVLESHNHGGAVLWRRATGEAAHNPKPIAAAPRVIAPAHHPPPARVRAPGEAHRSRAAIAVPKRVAGSAVSPQRSLEPQTQLQIGLASLDRGDVMTAVSALRKATYLDSGNALAQFALARVLLMLGETARAHSILLHARRLLAAIPDEDLVGSDTSAAELRRAVKAQLESSAVSDGAAPVGTAESVTWL